MPPLIIGKDQLQQAKNWLRYKKDPIAFFEECCYLPIAGLDRLVKLHVPQRKIVEDFYHNDVHNMIFLKSRQIGFSTLFQLISVHLLIFYNNIIIGVTSTQGKESSDFSKKVKDIIEKLPKLFNIKFKWNNIQSFSIEGTNSEFHSSTVSSINPGGLFRGKSIALLIMDEIAHVPKADDAWTGVGPALSAAQNEAKLKGIPYGTILISTPNKSSGMGKFFFDTWSAALNGENAFTPYRVHWTEVEAYKNDPTWYQTQCKILGNNQRKIQQELELQFVGTDNTFLGEETIRKLQTNKVDPSRKIKLKEGGELWQFKDKIDQKRFYLISADIASSYGKDFCTVEVMDFIEFDQILEYKGKITPTELADVIRMITIFCPNNLIIIENTGGFGLGTINSLEGDKNKDYNLFYEYRMQDSKKTRVPGLSTNSHSRPLIMQALFEAVSEFPEKVHSERLKLELLALVENKNGKVEAEGNDHDDLVMSYSFAAYVRKNYKGTLQIEEETGIESFEFKEDMDNIYELNGLSRFTKVNSKEDWEYLKDKIEKSWKAGEQVSREEVFGAIYGSDFTKTYLI